MDGGVRATHDAKAEFTWVNEHFEQVFNAVFASVIVSQGFLYLMNSQTKLALFIAPFLVVGGYIASDQYVTHQSNKGKLFNLTLQNSCQLFNGDCILKSGDVLVNITDNNGITKINTSYPAKKVTLSIVSKDEKETIYPLNNSANSQYWQRETAIRSTYFGDQMLKSIRIMVKIKGDLFLYELSASALN